jgi:hypothetical protein
LRASAADTIARVPFTISHAAAVLPLRKLGKARLPLAALMIGSMSPDFSYFFMPGDIERLATHSIAGLFWFCLPVSLAAWFLYVRVLEQPTIALLPDRWAARITPSSRDLTVASLAIVSAAILLGALTHIVWDSFTHIGSPVVNAVRGLRIVVFEWHGRPIRVFRLLQHLSSVLGMLVLAFFAWRHLRNAAPSPAASPSSIPHKARVGAVLLLFAVALAVAIVGYALNARFSLERRLFHFAIGGMTGWMITWLLIALVIRLRWRRRT